MSIQSLNSPPPSTTKITHWCRWCGCNIDHHRVGRARAFCDLPCLEEYLEDAKRRRAAGERCVEEINKLYGQRRKYRAGEVRTS